MNRTTVVHVRQVNMSDPDVVYIGRTMPQFGLVSTGWENPYHHDLSKGFTVQDSIALYEKLIRASIKRYPKAFDLTLLRNRRLACWCKVFGDEPCHGEVLLLLLRERFGEDA